MDDFTHPELGADSPRRVRTTVFVAVTIAALILLSIAGSAFLRPAPLPDTTLELGRTALVGLSDAGPDETMSRVLEFVAPTVAFLRVEETQRSGSGVVVHGAGFVITNAHVVEDADRLVVTFHDGTEYEADVYGVHPQSDLAVVKIETDEPLPVAALGDSDSLRVGEFVLALGAPFGLETSATSGIISGLHRSGLGIARYEDFIVTDAPINRGNSGGPLVNLHGEVIGINTAIVAGEDGHPGLGGFLGVGFAIPMNVARVVAQKLIGDGGLGGVVVAADDVPGAVAGRRDLSTMPREPEASSGSGPSEDARVQAAAGNEPTQTVGLPGSAVARVRALDASGGEINAGSGFVVRVGEGQMVITNAHVVRGAASVEIVLEGRQPLVGEVTHAEPNVDLAFVKLPGDDSLPFLEIAPPGTLALEDPIRALGMREAGRVAEEEGIVTRLPIEERGPPDPDRSVPVDARLIETSAQTVPGDSGGPLLSADGKVVGVLRGREDAAEAGSGARRSYAIPISELEPVLEVATGLGGAGQFNPGFTGLVSQMNGGVIVVNLDPEGLAARSGLKDGDFITAADGKSLSDPEVAAAWNTELPNTAPGTRIELTVERRVAGGAADEWEEVTVYLTVPERRP